MAIAPTDWVWSSNTDWNVVPPSRDFHTPPLAVPTQIVAGLSGHASIAAMRPLITAGPMARASNPPNAAASSLTCAVAAVGNTKTAVQSTAAVVDIILMLSPMPPSPS